MSNKNKVAGRRLHEIPAQEIKTALLSSTVGNTALEELTISVQTAFGLIRKTKMNSQAKETLFRLEMEFDFWKELVQQRNTEEAGD